MQWAPPAGGNERLGGLLAALDSLDLVERANAETLERIFRAEPVLIDVRPAGEARSGTKTKIRANTDSGSIAPPLETIRPVAAENCFS